MTEPWPPDLQPTPGVVVGLDYQGLAIAIRALAACDHFDEARRAVRGLPDDISIVDLLRAADGATRLAHDLDQLRRIAS